ncbi:MAG: UDP-N-acetylmuramoyl-L-alanine--D-glutamate ligase [Pseudomonadota bacterium]|nr:UDP-N-acetylmuramoyl-L-alanine--D-glutamate ligase [Pseudomonadota bacterium]
MGLGKSGLATARALITRGQSVCAWDDTPEKRDEAAKAGIPIVDLTAAPLDGFAALVLSPGIPHTWPRPHPVAARAKQAGLSIIGDIELLARANTHIHYIGITGTNGKSTTTALIGHILKEAGQSVSTGGNLGYPVLELPVPEQDGFYVLELSSYQLELTQSLVPDIAILLNLSSNHLDRHGGMDGYIAAKKRIFRGQKAPQTTIIGMDDPWSAALHTELARTSQAWIVPISAEKPVLRGVYVLDGMLFDDMDGGNKPVLDLSGLPALPGKHNAQNVAAAWAACRAAKIDPHAVMSAMRSFSGLAHRQQRVAQISGVTFINDSKATTADAAGKALACYSPVYWIVGGRPKEGGLSGLEGFMPRIAHAFVIGEAEEDFARWLEGKAPYTRCGDLKTATGRAAAMALADQKPGATVLLSPACASWDQFSSFEERGDTFAALVRHIR